MAQVQGTETYKPMSIEDDLKKLSLQGGELVDITQQLRTLADRLKPESIIKVPNFNLFEGTHSLEINNEKLDSSLLELRDEELKFDCNVAYGDSDGQQLAFITSIADQLCKLLMVWLSNYQTLPTTVLSCRYVEEILVRYTEKPVHDLTTCRLSTGSELYDQVLTSIVLGVCYFVKFMSALLRSGNVFEEEDLNCNTMGLDFFYTIPVSTISNQLDKSLILVENKYPGSEHLETILKLLKCLIHIQAYSTLEGDRPSTSMEPLQSLIQHATKLQEADIELHIPKGTFSSGIQKRLSNQFPPRDIVEPEGSEYQAFIIMAEDIMVVLEAASAESMLEIKQFASFFNRNKQRHVVARALFPMFIFRDDLTVLGEQNFSEFVLNHCMEFSLFGTKFAETLDSESEQGGRLVSLFSAFTLQNCDVLFEWYRNMAQNTCRYRQGYNRQLLLWDSLQAQAETFEMELEAEGIADTLENGATLLPLTSWSYYMKLNAMLEFVLKGFELEVYKPWEFYTMFWYSYYLSHHLESCLQRVAQFLEQRMATIHAMSKKIKKLKAGAKKDALRTRYKWHMENEIPQLKRNSQLMSYLAMDCTVSKSLSLLQVFQFGILKSFGIIDNKHLSSSKFTSSELTHSLRFKTFSSIGVPELPTYEMFESSLQDFIIKEPMFQLKMKKTLDFIEKEVRNVNTALDGIINAVKDGDKEDGTLITGTRLVKDQALLWYNGLSRTAQALQANTTVLYNKLGKQPDASLRDNYTVKITCPPGACPYFPLLTLVEKSKRK